MKKIFLLILTCLISTLLISNTVFASVDIEQKDWEDINLSDEEFEQILSQNVNNSFSTYATNLIEGHTLAISKKTSTLIIAGFTQVKSLTKCGFSKVTIQRRKNSSSSWTTYKTYTDLYNNTTYYRLSKSLSVPTGYQYRVTCTHYAKKNTTVEKINATSNIVSF